MTYHGIVKNGVVVLGDVVELPEGTEVNVEPIGQSGDSSEDSPTLVEQFSDIIGTVPDLPPDMAECHDHYLHGAPKQ